MAAGRDRGCQICSPWCLLDAGMSERLLRCRWSLVPSVVWADTRPPLPPVASPACSRWLWLPDPQWGGGVPRMPGASGPCAAPAFPGVFIAGGTPGKPIRLAVVLACPVLVEHHGALAFTLILHCSRGVLAGEENVDFS